MRSKLPKTTAHPIDYFQHNERKHNPKIVEVQMVEWEEIPIKRQPGIVVKESRDKRLIARAKRKWEKYLKESHK